MNYVCLFNHFHPVSSSKELKAVYRPYYQTLSQQPRFILKGIESNNMLSPHISPRRGPVSSSKELKVYFWYMNTICIWCFILKGIERLSPLSLLYPLLFQVSSSKELKVTYKLATSLMKAKVSSSKELKASTMITASRRS